MLGHFTRLIGIVQTNCVLRANANLLFVSEKNREREWKKVHFGCRHTALDFFLD